MTQDELLKQLTEKLVDLYFDYDRMSTSGQQTYDEIMLIVAQLNQQEGGLNEHQ